MAFSKSMSYCDVVYTREKLTSNMAMKPLLACAMFAYSVAVLPLLRWLVCMEVGGH